MDESHEAPDLLRIPPGAARALSHYVSKAVERIDPARYRQEAAYVAALFARLDGVVYKKSGLIIEIKSTIVADRGPNSAESKWGADFSIVAQVTVGNRQVEKGVLGQAKRGSLINLPSNDAEQFRQQVLKMTEATDAMIGLEVPNVRGALPVIRIIETPNIYQGVPVQKSLRKFEFSIQPTNPSGVPVYPGGELSIGRYLYAELLRCLHGDTDQRLVRGLESSALSYLLVDARRTE